jgi:hypothetical protein
MSKRTPQQPPRQGESTLNFRVAQDFRFEFRQIALDYDIKHAELLRRALAAWKRENDYEPRRRAQAYTGAAVAVVDQGVG